LAVVAVVIAGAAIGGYVIWNKSRTVVDPLNDVIAVTVQSARVTTMRETVTATGTVVPQTAADFVVNAPGPAEIAEMP
jgi:hypothetical protein